MPLRFRKRPQRKRHIVITGTGRAGTTLLVRIFHELGLETGFSENDLQRVEKNTGRAGLERQITAANAANLPLIIKSPWLVDCLPEALENDLVDVDVAIVPIRALEDAAKSRIAASERYRASGGAGDAAPGGLWKTNNPERQADVLAVQFYKIVETLQRHEIPTIFPIFPDFVTDFDHFDRTVGHYVRKRFKIGRRELRRAYDLQCNPDFVTVRSERDSEKTG